MPADVSTPQPTPDPAPTPPADPLEAMSPEARAEWRLTGTTPTAPASDAPDSEPPPEAAPDTTSTDADSSPAQPAAQAASTDATQPAASETATPKRKNAETRIKELLDQNKRLQEDLRRALSSSQSPAAPDGSAASSTTPPVSLDRLITQPDLSHPPLSDTEFYELFPNAGLADFVDYRASYRQARASVDQQRVSTLESKFATYGAKLETIRTADPDLFDRLPEVVQQAVPTDLLDPGVSPAAWNYAAQAIVESDQAGAILAHLADHPEAVTAITRATSPSQAIRLVTTIEARLTPAPVPAGSPVSLAPKPPAVLGTKPAQPADEMADAIRRGDFDTYRRLMNRKDMKSA